jgi:DnaJ-class molecular chaperone
MELFGSANPIFAIKNCREMLNIPTTAGLKSIEKAFRREAKQYHPDKNGGEESKEWHKLTACAHLLTENAKKNMNEMI